MERKSSSGLRADHNVSIVHFTSLGGINQGNLYVNTCSMEVTMQLPDTLNVEEPTERTYSKVGVYR